MDSNKRVVGYEVVKANTPSRLQAHVKAYLEKGWTPLGAPFCDVTGEIYQALIFTQVS
ncbi:MAG TPA: DUF1737 domain-containing protein [Candidatus Limnocylindrales bacterium]|nr:DUF1737 domain-containing protein [Candidatus Limnocylindrales bacterium]